MHDTPEVLTVVVDVENNYVDEDNDIDQAPTVQHTSKLIISYLSLAKL